MTGPQFVKAIFMWFTMLILFYLIAVLCSGIFGEAGGFVLAGCFIVPTTLYWSYSLAQIEN